MPFSETISHREDSGFVASGFLLIAFVYFFQLRYLCLQGTGLAEKRQFFLIKFFRFVFGADNTLREQFCLLFLCCQRHTGGSQFLLYRLEFTGERMVCCCFSLN